MTVNLSSAMIGLAALITLPTAAMGIADLTMGSFPLGEPQPAAETVDIRTREIQLPLPGEFLAGGRPVAAPVETISFERPLRIMKHQVSAADYALCVDAGTCKPADGAVAPAGATIPVTGVSYLDATAFAGWYSAQTGREWRLPSAAEWAAAAAERFVGDPYSASAGDDANPAIAWIRRYREEAATRRQPDPQPKPRGFYGPNSNGVEDMAGNVWEWTSTCYRRVTVGADGAAAEAVTDNCGVHVVEGRHRAYMSNFIRDGKSGGCAVGTPPENLGFRLVLEDGAPRLVASLGRAIPLID